jgi:glycosyltransferase involved in cell wall biosynthesis
MSGKKRVLIYSEYWSSRGGGEKYLLCCIETLLRSGYDVTIVAQAASIDKDAVSRYFQVNIDAATVRFVDGDLNALRREAEQMSREFDICIYMTNYRFFNSHARQTFVVLQIPYGRITPFNFLTKTLSGKPKEAAKDFYRIQLLRKLRETQAVLVYSKFVHDSLEEIHSIPSTILEPAIDDFAIEGATKERVILSVGRFFSGLYNDKRYDVLVEAFKRLCKRLPNTTWQYRLVGSCGNDEASQRYLEELREEAKGLPIYFHINSPYEELQRHYNEATLFWHAAGFGVNEGRRPERTEHFGMSTLEAMSARCVPVVINRGGQKEIVSDGESGYLWNSMDELVDHSIKLMADQSLLATMQTKARERFKEFDREHFSDKLLSILQP